MDEFESQVTEQEIDEGAAGQESVVDSQEEDVTESNRDPGEGGKADPASQRQEVGQSHQDNAAAKAARIRAEQETAQRLRRQYDEQVAGMGIVLRGRRAPVVPQRDKAPLLRVGRRLVDRTAYRVDSIVKRSDQWQKR